MLPAPLELKASSIVQLIEQWSMMQWSLLAMPMPSRVSPATSPGRTRRKRTTTSWVPMSPRLASTGFDTS